MDGLILAAGKGTRLRAFGDSKPLTTVAGKPLIEIAIRQLARAGAERIVVATGHEAERLEGHLPDFAAAAGVTVESARVVDWSLPNGYSVMAGAARLEGEFLLVMADHILSLDILQGLAACREHDTGVTLAIDRRTEAEAVDPDDATWVRTGRDNRIMQIGKGLTDYDAVDCGAFLATPELPRAIATAIANGRPGSLSDGMQLLADTGRAHARDIGGAWWIDVDDPRAHAMAEQQASQHVPGLVALSPKAARRRQFGRAA